MAEDTADQPSLYDQAGAQWQDAVDRIRETAKWTTVVFGAVGGLLAGTAPLTGLATLDWGRHGWLAVGFGLLALGGIGLVVGAASAVLLPRTVTLADLAGGREFKILRRAAEADPSLYLLPYAESIPEFSALWRCNMRSLRQFERLWREHHADPTATAHIDAAYAVVAERVNAMAPVARYLLMMGIFEQVRRRFSGLRLAIFAGGGTAAVGIAGFLATVGTAPAAA